LRHIKASGANIQGGSTKGMPPICFSENATAIKMKSTWMIHTSFAVMKPFFHKVSIIFNTFLPMYTNVKFLALTLEYIMKTLVQFLIICKMASM
jgi:hypothetical protein